MSRCFPYPPPGYVRNGASGEALIESIKLQRETEKAKRGLKKEKREKKEKSTEKIVKEKKISSDGSVKKLYDGKCHKEKGIVDSIGRHPHKNVEDEAEQLEKSGITEEYKQPHGSQSYSSDGTQSSNKRKRNTSPLSGSQERGHIIRIRLSVQKNREHDAQLNKEQPCSTSGKAEYLIQPKEVVSIPRQEQHCSTNRKTNIIAGELTARPHQEQHTNRKTNTITGELTARQPRAHQEQHFSANRKTNTIVGELTARPHKEQHCSANRKTNTITGEPTARPHQEQHCSTNRKTNTIPGELTARTHQEQQHCSTYVKTNTTAGELTARPDKEPHGSDSGRKDIFSHYGAETASATTSHEKRMQRAESRYKLLIGNWVPHQLEPEQNYLDDEGWLFDTQKQEESHGPKRFKAGNDVSCYGSSTLWPCAHFLPEADIHALPYTIPF